MKVKVKVILWLRALYFLVCGLAQIFSGLCCLAIAVYGLFGWNWQAIALSPAFIVAFSIAVFENVKKWIYRIIWVLGR